MDSKFCSGCEVVKSTSHFCKNKYTKDLLNWWCKDCQKEYRKANDEDIKFTQKHWYQNNKVKLKNERDRKNKLGKRV